MTKISSKGQVVIPAELRSGFETGEKLLVIRNDDQIIMKKASQLDEKLQEDLAFAKRTEDALISIEAGQGTKMEFDEFMSELEKW